MKICKNCKEQVQEENKFCTNCGGAEFITETESQPEQQNEQNNGTFEQSSPPPQPYYNTVPLTDSVDKVNPWLVVLSVLIPIVGIILFFVKKKDKPKEAKACGIAGLVVIILNVLISIIIIISSFGLMGAMFSGLNNLEVEQSKGSVEYYNEETEAYQSGSETTIGSTNSSTTENSVSKDNTNNSTKFTDYSMCYNGKKITFPCSYDTFSSTTGYAFDDDDVKDSLNEDEYNTYQLGGGNATVVITLANTTNQTKSVKECTVIGVTVENSIFEDEPYEESSQFSFVNNLTVGQTTSFEKLEKMFGEPANSYTGTTYNSIKFEEEPPEDVIMFQSSGIEFELNENGVIESISTENFIDALL